MLRKRNMHHPDRRGVILLVVLTLLALFAVIGLSFALYAEQEATAARIAREAVDGGTLKSQYRYDVEQGAHFAMGQILFDVGDGFDVNAPQMLYSGLRGHSLARAMYGYNSGFDGTMSYPALALRDNLSPYSGQGRVTGAAAIPTFPPINMDTVVNYSLAPSGEYIFDPERTMPRTGANAGTLALAGNYQNVAAPYTYPDLKDFYLAARDPMTGRIVQPSFHRTWGPFDPTQMFGLSPQNPNWTSQEGRLYTVRPRPIDQLTAAELATLGANPTPAQVQTLAQQVGAFPYPQPNADGSFTGDVQNLPNPQGVQQNDSIWIYPGGPVLQTESGRQYTTVVAPLILDMNGKIDLSVAGNRKGPSPDPTKTMVSGSGVGPWEIDPTKIFALTGLPPGTEATALQQILSGNNYYDPTLPPPTPDVAGRYGLIANNPPIDRITQFKDPTTMQNSVRFNGPGTATQPLGRVPPFYSRVDFDGADSSPTPMPTNRMNPIGSGTSPFPDFPKQRYFDATTQSMELNQHPALYQPNYWTSQWAPTATIANPGRSFTAAELQWLFSEYGDEFVEYAKADIVKLAPQILGNSDYSAANPTPTQRLNDPANLIRLLTTIRSSDLSRPEIIVSSNNALGFTRLGPIDLNRDLTDYRTDPSKMYAPDNMGNAGTAQLDRQRMARDIFVRLAATVGFVDTPTTPNPSKKNITLDDNPTSGTYGYLNIAGPLAPTDVEAIRAMAQLAVNIVDYIDADDISTTFVFDPTNVTLDMGATELPLTGITPANIGDKVVFGTELPRLALNEVFVDVGNARADFDPRNGINQPPMEQPANSGIYPASENFRKRCWIELYNTMKRDTALSENGLARLHYPMGVLGAMQAYSPYSIAVTEYVPPTPTIMSQIDHPSNVTGSFRHSTTPVAIRTPQMLVDKFEFDSSQAMEDPTQQLPVVAGGIYAPTDTLSGSDGGLERYVVQPQPAMGMAVGANAKNDNGFVVLGPSDNFPGQNTMMNPGTPAATIRIQQAMPTSDPMNPKPINALELDTETKMTGGPDLLKPVSVYLRRLANPYFTPNDPLEPSYNPALPINPYLTVDRSENITVQDNIHFDQNGEVPTYNPSMKASQGRAEPYAAGQAFRAPQMTPVPGSPMSTFFRQNSNATAPFHWLTHLDRKLINALEMVHVAGYGIAPSSLTNQFAQVAGGPPAYNRHSAASQFLAGLGTANTGGIANGVGTFFKTLDLLQVGPHQTGMAVGATTHGKVNVNTVTYQTVLEALLAANPNANYFNATDVQTMWSQFTGSPNPQRMFNTPPTPNFDMAGDPIKGFMGATGMTPQEQQKQTILRNDMTTMAPIFYTPQASRPPSDPSHPVGIVEPLAKMWNNTTTTSNNFLIIMTVSLFEVRGTDPATGRVYLGKEMFQEYPGDLREKFISYVDRTNLAVDVNSPTQQNSEAAFFTRLVKDVQPGESEIVVEAGTNNAESSYNPTLATDAGIFINGQAVSLMGPQGRQLQIGYGRKDRNGADGETLTTFPTPTNQPAVGPLPATPPFQPYPPTGGIPELLYHQAATGENGRMRIALQASAQLFHPAGSPVSNALLGNPGPQSFFDPQEPRYSNSLVPFFRRIER